MKISLGIEEIDLSEIVVPDLWDVGQFLKKKGLDDVGDAVLETWHLAHSLLNHVREDNLERSKWVGAINMGITLTDVLCEAMVNDLVTHIPGCDVENDEHCSCFVSLAPDVRSALESMKKQVEGKVTV